MKTECHGISPRPGMQGVPSNCGPLVDSNGEKVGEAGRPSKILSILLKQRWRSESPAEHPASGSHTAGGRLRGLGQLFRAPSFTRKVADTSTLRLRFLYLACEPTSSPTFGGILTYSQGTAHDPGLSQSARRNSLALIGSGMDTCSNLAQWDFT